MLVCEGFPLYEFGFIVIAKQEHSQRQLMLIFAKDSHFTILVS